jgi:hypothetical protein
MDDNKFGPGYGQRSGYAPGYVPASGPAASLPEPSDLSPAGDRQPDDTGHESNGGNGAGMETLAPAADQVEADPAVERFRSCRWKASDAGDFCTHRDVLPFAGKEGFKPESWCPECAFYKLRRTPKKRDRNDYMY